MSDRAPWKYCVVGNILKTCVDERDLSFRNGTAAFRGGARVYLYGKPYSFDQDRICVLGLTRGHRFQVVDVSPQLIENVRLQQVYKPAVLKIMNNWEFRDSWWHDTEEDRKDAARFVIRVVHLKQIFIYLSIAIM